LDYECFVVELPWLKSGAFLSLMRQADVYLDTIGFSGFNTAMQAIESGLPVVTVDGRFMRGRLASGILKRLGMTETIADSPARYVDLAVTLAQDEGFRRGLRTRIERGRADLFQDRAPVRALESFLARVATA
jgi:predicted O-linked N-acetylglucosamine transferase (SPINDLY family)